MLRAIPLILLALFIDFLQVGLAFGIIGASGTFAWIPFIGQAIAAGGFVMSVVVNMCISLTFGTLLTTLLLFSGFFSSRILSAFAEVIPGINNAPVWTIATLVCVFRKLGEESAGGALQNSSGVLQQLGFAGAAGTLGQAALGASVIHTADRAFQAQPEQPTPQRTEARVRPALKNIDGVRRVAAVLLYMIIGLSAPTALLHAQTTGVDTSSIRLLSSPEAPGPNTQVRLEVQGVGNFVGDATITWQRDGSTVQSGVGERVYTFTTGGLGSVTRIKVIVESAAFGTMTREVTFAPAEVYMVWEADTSVPPLYRGKALYSAGSQVTVTAFPQVVANGRTISYNNFSFQWKRNGSTVPAQSGTGHNTLTLQGNQLQSGENITVDVLWNGTLVAQGSTFIPARDPQILLYPSDPLRGVLFDQAFPGAISLGSSEVTVQAVPFYFANDSLADGSLTYQWTLNGSTASGPDAARGTLTLRQSGEGSGEAVLGVSLQNTNPTKLLQAAETMLRIVFGNQTQSSLFGL